MNGTFLNKIVSLLYSSCNIEYFRQIIKHSHVIPFYLTFHYQICLRIFLNYISTHRTVSDCGDQPLACNVDSARWQSVEGVTRRFLSRECEAEFGDIVAVLGGGIVCHLANIIVVGILNQWRHRFPEIRSIYWDKSAANWGIMAACQTRKSLFP